MTYSLLGVLIPTPEAFLLQKLYSIETQLDRACAQLQTCLPGGPQKTSFSASELVLLQAKEVEYILELGDLTSLGRQTSKAWQLLAEWTFLINTLVSARSRRQYQAFQSTPAPLSCGRRSWLSQQA